MVRLEKEEIQFIDTYLKNSEVVFADLRVEMIDHVASNIEQRINEGDTRGFYYVFKDYMVKNKTLLLKENRTYYKISDKKIFRKLTEIAFSYKGFAVLTLILISFILMNKILSQNMFLVFIQQAPFFMILIVGLAYFFIIKQKNERYSSIERISFYFMLAGQLINLTLNSQIDSEIITPMKLFRLLVFASIIIFGLCMLLITAFQFKKEYQLKFKNII